MRIEYGKLRFLVLGTLVLGLIWGGGRVGPAGAQVSGPEILQALEDTFATVAEKVKPAVVHLSVERVGNETDPRLERLREQLPPEFREPPSRLPL